MRARGSRLPLALVATLTAAACGDPTGPPEKLEALPRQLSVAEQEVIDASNDFTFRLLQRVVADPELGADNVFLSPFSVSMALGMTLNGAAGETFEGMRSTLGFGGLDQEAINVSYRDLTELLLGLDSRTELRIANSVWAREGFPVRASFYDAVRAYFDAEARALDFDAPTAKDEINGWVRDATNDRIEEIVESISADDVMFLVNAVYFKGQWTNRFDRDDTGPREFSLDGAGPVQVEMMNGNDLDVGVFYRGGIQGGELPYGNQAFTMVVVMPEEGGSVDELVASLDADTWESWMEGLVYDERPVSMPKLELEYDASLGSVLADLGMGAALTPGVADFSNLSTAAQLYISRVMHKTFLKVDEEGTEAAAVTSVGVTLTSAPLDLTVDRPYILAIRERLSGTILFIGVIRDPR